MRLLRSTTPFAVWTIAFLCSAGDVRAACLGGNADRRSVLFVNGIHITFDQAAAAAERVDEVILKAIDSGTLQVNEDCILTSLAYNPTNGYISDVFEAARQKGLTDESFVSRMIFGLVSIPVSFDLYGLTKSYLARELESQVTDDLASLAKSARTIGGLLLVGHSQGSLYVNRIFEDRLTVSDRARTAVVTVANPSDHSAGNGGHTTLVNDPVISLIAGAQNANADNGPCPNLNSLIQNLTACHDFLKSYLREDVPSAPDPSLPQIMNDIVAAFLVTNPTHQFITFRFAGLVTSTSETDLLVGSTLTGTFTYDLSATDQHPSPQFGEYEYLVEPNGVVVDIGSRHFSTMASNGINVSVWNNTLVPGPILPGGGAVGVKTDLLVVGGSIDPLAGGGTVGIYFEQILPVGATANPALLSSDQLPTSLDLSLVNNTNHRIEQAGASVNFSITSLQRLP